MVAHGVPLNPSDGPRTVEDCRLPLGRVVAIENAREREGEVKKSSLIFSTFSSPSHARDIQGILDRSLGL